jgi:hypothetical protein
MKTSLRLALALAACFTPACSDDAVDPVGGAGSEGGNGGDGEGASGEGGAGGGGGPGPSCAASATLAGLDAGGWDDRFTISGFVGPDGIAPLVYDFAVAGDGSVVAAGRFQWLDGEQIPPLMRFHEGEWEPARATWELPAPADGFSAIAIENGGTVALATNDSFGERDGEIWIDQGAGLESIAAFEGQVRSLAWFDGALWAAGVFTLDETPVSGLAVWNGATWAAPPLGALDGDAYELFVDGASIYVGGTFTQVGGIDAANVAAFDGEAWSAFDFPEAVAIFALTTDAEGQLFAGGAYGAFEEASGVAQWTGSEWQTLGAGLAQYETRGVVSDLVAHDGVIEATGCFSSANGKPSSDGAEPARGFARWNGEAWLSLADSNGGEQAPWFQPLACGDEGTTAIWDAPQQRLAFAESRLFAGGSFAGIDGVLSQSIATRDDDGWQPVGAGSLGVGGSIDRVATGGDSCELFGVGTFTHVGGQAVDARVARFDGSSWHALGDPLPADAYCPAIDVGPAGEVAVGCMEFPPTGDAVGRVLRFDGDALVVAPLEGLGPISALAFADGALYVAGGSGTGYVARIDGDDVTIIEAGFDGIVNQLKVLADDDIVVAGSFTKVGAVDAARIARFDGASWSSLGDGLPGQALALARDASTVYVSTYDEGAGAFLLGAFDGESWTELATPAGGLTPQTYFSFNSLEIVDGAIIASGTAELDDGSGRGVLVYRDGELRALAGGVGAISVGNVAFDAGSMWVAGVIAQAGTGESAVSSVGVARLQWGP